MITMNIKRFYLVSIVSQSELYIFSLAMPPLVPRKALNLKQKVDIYRFKAKVGLFANLMTNLGSVKRKWPKF